MIDGFFFTLLTSAGLVILCWRLTKTPQIIIEGHYEERVFDHFLLFLNADFKVSGCLPRRLEDSLIGSERKPVHWFWHIKTTVFFFIFFHLDLSALRLPPMTNLVVFQWGRRHPTPSQRLLQKVVTPPVQHPIPVHIQRIQRKWRAVMVGTLFCTVWVESQTVQPHHSANLDCKTVVDCLTLLSADRVASSSLGPHFAACL